MTTLLTIEIRFEQDVVMSRQRARQIAELLGFDPQDQTRIATAVSEIARNAYKYAKIGKVEFRLAQSQPTTFKNFIKTEISHLEYSNSFSQYFWIYIYDRGEGIPNLNNILAGNYNSQTGMGLGIIGSKRLMDQFYIESTLSTGTKVLMGKILPKRSNVLTPKKLAEIVDNLVMKTPQNPFEEIQQQNQELIRTLEELSKRQEELTQLNRELEDTNRGVVALYAELDEKAEFLQRANELKTRFLSNMSHEFRTPLNSILSLSQMLLDRMDGSLTTEQEKQVMFIRKSAEGLSELVNDLLDLAKVEAGKIVVHPNEFEVKDLFATLRGMLRPLLNNNSSLSLLFEETVDIPSLFTDESKVAQILRNFISNAIKYTERGEVLVKANVVGQYVVFSVTDTGIGIAQSDQERIFEEFIQLDSQIQNRVKGTGLGLPLSRRLAELLGGTVSVKSELGKGSTFLATIPLIYGGFTQKIDRPKISWELNSSLLPLLVVEDNESTLFTYHKYLEKSIYQMIGVRSLKEAKQALQNLEPKAVILDILLEDESAWDFLSEIKENPLTHHIPILVATVVDNEKKARALGADDFLIKPVERMLLLQKINKLVKGDKQQKILIIDDSEVSRYLLKEILTEHLFEILEATEGMSGIQLAKEEKPDCIFLDLVMSGTDGFEALQHLKNDLASRNIPVIINTSKHLTAQEQLYLEERAVAVISKESVSSEARKAMLQEALIKAGLA